MAIAPKEYKKGFVKFLDCKIDLSQRTFIPRIETEYWVKKAIAGLKKCNKELKVLDIFSGSGCIGIAALKYFKNSHVDFADADRKAFLQIRKNLKINKIPENRYKVFLSDFFVKIKGRYDIIFANPPYVAKERKKEVDASVLKYEPEAALFSGKKGLNHIKEFLKKAKKHLNKGGVIFLEYDPEQKSDIKRIIKKEGYKSFKFHKDQFKKYRWLKIVFT